MCVRQRERERKREKERESERKREREMAQTLWHEKKSQFEKWR